MKKTGRNDPCPCGSGKKFKKCCESKMIGKKFMATKIETSTIQKSSKLSSFFQQKITQINKPEDFTKETKIDSKSKQQNESSESKPIDDQKEKKDSKDKKS